jgi:hypothetical protein
MTNDTPLTLILSPQAGRGSASRFPLPLVKGEGQGEGSTAGAKT